MPLNFKNKRSYLDWVSGARERQEQGLQGQIEGSKTIVEEKQELKTRPKREFCFICSRLIKTSGSESSGHLAIEGTNPVEVKPYHFNCYYL